jgi:predicted nicotinamide N-methyase
MVDTAHPTHACLAHTVSTIINMLNTMPRYQTKEECIAITGVDDLIIRSLLDKQQFSDPHGDAARMGISSAMWPIFGLLWPSGAELAARMAARVMLPNERVLEIGCGLALASLVAHRRGVDVTASDCHPLAATFLRNNLSLNLLTPLPYRHGHWSSLLAPIARDGHAASTLVSGRYDLLIASDVLYERDAEAMLPKFIANHTTESAEIWIVDPNRGNRAAFSKQMTAMGYHVIEERLDRLATSDAVAYKGRLLVYSRY